MAYPSTFADLQSEVLTRLRLNVTNDTSRVKDWINQAYTNATLESGYMRRTHQSALIAGDTKVALPGDLGRLRTVRMQPAAGNYQKPLQRVGLARLNHYRSLQPTTTGAPCFYSITQVTMEFFPTAVGGETVQFWYTARPDTLVNNADAPELPEPYATNCLKYGAMAEGAAFLNDIISEYNYRQLYQEWLQRFQMHTSDREGVALEPPQGAQQASRVAAGPELAEE